MLLPYSFDPFDGGFVELLAAQQTLVEDGKDWYQGTADAVRKNLNYMSQRGIDYVVIISGDQLYRMDYRELINTHKETGADVTIAARPVTRDQARAFGIMRIDETARVTGFLEKPQTEEELAMVRMDPSWIDARGIDSQGRDCLASLGIYVFNTKTLVEALDKTDYADFGKEVFPAAIRSRHVQAHMYDDYWEDIGTIKSFFDSNLSMAGEDPPFDFYAREAPVYSRARYLPPTQFTDADVTGSLIADGCKIGKGAKIENSIIGLRCLIGENVTIRNSIVMGADYYEDEQSKQENFQNDMIPIGVGSGAEIVGAIVDKNCRIGPNVVIRNDDQVQNTSEEHPSCVIRDGIPVVIKNSLLPAGWTLESLAEMAAQ